MKFYSVLFLSLSLSVFSCKKDKSQRGISPNEASTVDLNITSSSEKVSFKTDDNAALFTQYLAIKAAMVNTNAKETKKTAARFGELFKGKQAYLNARQVAVLISKESDMKKQREFFVGLTDEVTKILSADVASGKIFQQFCPMAFEGKGGYWLSDSQEVRNPYFGDKMLKCGTVSKTIQ